MSEQIHGPRPVVSGCIEAARHINRAIAIIALAKDACVGDGLPDVPWPGGINADEISETLREISLDLCRSVGSSIVSSSRDIVIAADGSQEKSKDSCKSM